jgi:long-chain acyl-CoA synthetase
VEKPWLSHYEAAVPHSLTYPQVPLHQMLEDSARKFPDNVATHLVLSYIGPLTIGGALTYR